MKYTRAQYEAFYYLNKLLPYLSTLDDMDWKFNRINHMKDRGLLVPIPKEEKESKKNLYPQIMDALSKYGAVYAALMPTLQQKNISYLARVLHLTSKEEMIIMITLVEILSLVQHFLHLM